jgi:hypothetical protein
MNLPNRDLPRSLPRRQLLRRGGAVALLAALVLAPARAQTACAGFVATDASGVRLVDGNGVQLFHVTGLAFPWTEVARFGPRLLVSDNVGFRILDRQGAVLGNVLPRLGLDQTVVPGLDRIAVVEDDRVRIVGRDGQAIGAPILKTGAGRQRAHVTAGGNVVVIDDDRVRVFGRDGLPRGAPFLIQGARADVYTTPSGLVILVDDQATRILDENGVPRGAPIATRGANRPTVTTGGGRVIVTDDQGTRIFGEDGTFKTEYPKTGTNRQQVTISGDRIVIVDDDRVRVTDLDGFPIGGPVLNGTPAQGRQTITLTDDRVIVTDGNGTQVFDKATMLSITTIARQGLDRQRVTADGDRILIREENQVRIFGSDGVQRGASIARSGVDEQYVRIRDNTILVIDTDRVRVFDRTGTMLRDVPAVNVREYNVSLFDGLFSLTSNDGWVEIRDAVGLLQGQRIAVSPAVQHVQCTADRVLIVDNAQLRWFTRVGVPVGAVVQTGADPWVVPLCWRACGSSSYDQGCGAPGFVPQLTASGDAIPGNTIDFVSLARPFAPVVFALGLSNEVYNGLPLPFSLAPLGAAGCRVVTALDSTTVVASGAGGDAEHTVSVPANARFVGLRLFAQAIVLDPLANPLGLALSNGVAVVVGEGN